MIYLHGSSGYRCRRDSGVLPGSICVVPFSSGANKNTYSETFIESTRKDCLSRTVASAAEYFEQVFITTANRYDFIIASGFGSSVTAFFISGIQSRELLLCFSLLVFQDLLHRGRLEADYVCYNEFDSELFFEDIHTDAALLDSSLFISPVLVERYAGRNRDVPGIPVLYRGQKYFAHTGAAVADACDGYYVPDELSELCSSAWLCTRRLFLTLPIVEIVKDSGCKTPRLSEITSHAHPMKACRWSRCFAQRHHRDIIYRKVVGNS